MLNTKSFIIGLVLLIGLPILLIVESFPRKAQAQNVIELACPAGSYALGGLTTRNPSTGGIRQYGCVDANGNLSLSNAVAPGGSNTQVQYNNSGVFGANAGFTYNGSAASPLVSIAGSSNAGELDLGLGNGSAGAVLRFGGSGPTFTSDGTNLKANAGLTFTTVAFASLGTVPAAGIGTKFCTDCTTAATCVGAGSGHLAVSNGTNWTCQ